jgi:hypothetical protein
MSVQEQKTLADIKAGEEVAMRSGWGDYLLLIVKSVSRGIIELENGNRYRADGSPLAKGERHYRPSPIEPVTDEIRRVNKKASLVSKLSGIKQNEWEKLDVETLEAIVALIWKTEQL